MMQKPSEEVYLFTQVVKLYGDNYCDVYANGDPSAFSAPLFWSNLFCWAFCFLILAVGPRAIEIKALITVPARFILIIIFVIKFSGLNSEVKGDGMGWYLNGDSFPLPGPSDEPT
jgi:purine-cytosine permease-like protein